MYRRVFALLAALFWLASAGALADAGHAGVADASDMTDVIDVAPEGLEPVTADRLNAGVWEVAVDSSSSMFKILGCALTVEGEAMTACLTMKSDAYLYLYPGAPEEAAAAEEAALIPLETGDGEYRFTFPVPALDAGVACAAFSARKQLWYPRTLRFRADSLPAEAWREAAVTAESLGLADGAYTVEATLEGGRATLESPARLTVSGGACTARIVFGTSRIDYVLVDGEKVLPAQAEGNAAFSIPVAAFDRRLPIIVDSTAITPAAEVAYTICFDSSTITPVDVLREG